MNTSELLGSVEMTNEAYHSGPGISVSHLKPMAVSPLHYWDQYINPNRPPRVETPAMRLGTAFHTVLLEPDEFEKRYAVAPECDRRTKEGKATFAAFEAENLGKIILSATDWDTCKEMREAAMQNPDMRQLMSIGINERAFFAKDPKTGMLIKCKPDKLRDDHCLIINLKTSADASKSGFGRQATNLGYYRDAAWAADILEMITGEQHTFAFVVVESVRPFAVAAYYVNEREMNIARNENRRLLDRIHKFRTEYEGRPEVRWPAYQENGAEPLELSGWRLHQAQVSGDDL